MAAPMLDQTASGDAHQDRSNEFTEHLRQDIRYDLRGKSTTTLQTFHYSYITNRERSKQFNCHQKTKS